MIGSKISINTLNMRDATYVLSNLRTKDWQELSAMLPIGTTRIEAVNIMLPAMNGPSFSVSYKDQPIAVFGVSHTDIATLYVAYAFGTNRFNRAAPGITEFGITYLAPWLIKNGALRLEVRSHVEHTGSNTWLTKLGFNLDCKLKRFGTSGETFNLYSATIDDYRLRAEPTSKSIN